MTCWRHHRRVTDVGEDAAVTMAQMNISTISSRRQEERDFTRAAEPAPPSRQAFAWNVTAVSLGTCAAILAIKLFLLRRININWDEFYFLSHVYSLRRGDLATAFQTAYAHLFLWLPRIPGDEITQIEAARGLMLLLLALSVAMLWRLASRWSSPAAAAVAPLAYLATSPVLRHGGSFRADSLLLPLTLAMLLWLTRSPKSWLSALGAGAALGASVAVSIKAVLLLPLLLAFAVFENSERRRGLHVDVRPLLMMCVVAIATACILIFLHRLSLPAVLSSGGSVASATRHAGEITLLDVHLFPQWYYFEATLRSDPLTWLLLVAGCLVALGQLRSPVAAFALSLLPLVFYRNAFPYYYVVMLAPACVLASVAIDSMYAFVRRHADQAAAVRIRALIILAIAVQAAINLSGLRNDGVTAQREVVNAVHRIFPVPVPYIDHSGMIASFPKANFFMSSWGIADYQRSGIPFVSEAINRSRPPLLLANRRVLQPDTPEFQWLLPEDRSLIRRFYVEYWGPIRIAGAEVTLVSGVAVVAELPLSGRYRVESERPVLVDAKVRREGDVIDVLGPAPQVTIQAPAETAVPLHLRLLWADAGRPPPEPPPKGELYTVL